MSEQREQFQRRVEELVARFEAEVDRGEWITRRYPKRLRDEAREVYEVPALYLQRGATSLLLDPIGYDVPGADADADIYLMPTYDPMASLYLEHGQWLVHCAFPLEAGEARALPESRAVPLSSETINRVLNFIANNAVPSV